MTKLQPDTDQRAQLEKTIDEWRRGCQLATDLAWNVCHQPGDIQSLAYDQIRSETALGSQHAILATRAASEAIKGCIDRFRTGRNASRPTFSAPTVRYDARSMTLFEDGTVSLATTGSRVPCPLKLPDAEDGYQFQYLNDPTWEPAGSTLTVRDGSIYLHIGVRRPKQDGPVDVTHPAAEGGAVLGVDMGVNRIAVTSTA